MRKHVPSVILLLTLTCVGCASLRNSSSLPPESEGVLRVDSGPYDPSTLSPDGKTLYFTWEITGTPQVWKIDGPMHFPQQLTGAPDANQIWATSPDGESLVVIRKAIAKKSTSGIVIMSKNNATEVVVPNDLACDLKPFWITNDNSKLYYLCYDQISNRTSIFSYAIDSSQSEAGTRDTKREQLFKESGRWSIVDVQNDQSFLLMRMNGPRTGDYFEWSPSEKVLNPIVGLPTIEQGNMRFARSRGEYLFFEPSKNQFFVFKDGRASRLELNGPEIKVRSFAIDHRRLHLFVETNDESLAVFDLRFEMRVATRLHLPELAALHAPKLNQTSRYDRYSIFNGKSATASFVQIVYDWKDQKPTQWLPSISFAIPPAP